MENQEPDELGRKYEVGLLDKAFGLQQLVFNLTFYGNVLGDPLFGGLSQILVLREMALFNQYRPIVKLEGEGP